MAQYAYRVLFDPLPEGGYHVIVPAIPEIITYGSTLEEAREMAQDAIACHIRGLLKDGEELPEDISPANIPICEQLRIAV